MTEILLDTNKLILKNRILDIHKKNGVVKILDIDSGYLTDFICEVKRDYNLKMKLDCITETNSVQIPVFYGHRILKRRYLTCSDSSYNKLFTQKRYEKLWMVKSQQDWKKKMYNVFYEIKDNDLLDEYDLVLITGPNSNGRDIAFLHIKDRVKSGSFILLNELDRYTSLETMRLFFDTKVAFKNNVTIDRIGLYKIVALK